MGQVTIDLVTKARDGSFVLILVEQGPWADSETHSRLQQLQNRLYDVVDAAVNGQVAIRFPETLGKPLTLRLDCYEVPRDETERLFSVLSEFVRNSTEYQAAIRKNRFMSSLEFQYSWDTLD